jgi:hypothetical protein
MSVQTQDIKRPVHRVPAIIAFVLAGVFVVVGLLGAPAFYAFAAFSALCGLIWALGGGAHGEMQSSDDLQAIKYDWNDSPSPYGTDSASWIVYGGSMQR